MAIGIVRGHKKNPKWIHPLDIMKVSIISWHPSKIYISVSAKVSNGDSTTMAATIVSKSVITQKYLMLSIVETPHLEVWYPDWWQKARFLSSFVVVYCLDCCIKPPVTLYSSHHYTIQCSLLLSCHTLAKTWQQISLTRQKVGQRLRVCGVCQWLLACALCVWLDRVKRLFYKHHVSMGQVAYM